MTLNKKLLVLYKKNWEKMRRVKKEHGLSSPLLIKLRKQRVTLFVVGQETYGWWKSGSLNDLRNNYSKILDACLSSRPPAKKAINKTYHSRFWYMMRNLQKELKIDLKKESIAWSNLNRMDNGEKEKPFEPTYKISEEMIDEFPLLKEEIKICKPKVIIFFTGNKWNDELLKKTFGEVKFEKLNSVRKENLARLKIKGISAKMYRTWHPNSFKKGREKIIKTILSDYNS
ncbi:MAG: hypothetical protein V1847_03610, partial [Candidatus Diapherotrites archaeon]